MRLVVQRATTARVEVDGAVVGALTIEQAECFAAMAQRVIDGALVIRFDDDARPELVAA